mgnify:CR=1 FL=1
MPEGDRNVDTEMQADSDQLRRVLFEHTDIRGEIVTLESSYREVLSHNPLPPAVARQLGEFLAAVSILSSTLKFDGILTLQARGSGPVPLMMAECTHHKQLRAVARVNESANDPVVDDAELANMGLCDLIGRGHLVMTIDPDHGERYQGVVPLEKASLAACLEDYFERSEQLATRFWFAADGERAGGLMLQMLPRQLNASAEDNAEHWRSATELAGTVTARELLGLDHATVLYRLFNEEQVRVFEPAQVRFACSCSRERTGRALLHIGAAEVRKLLMEQGTLTLDCQFCGQQYQYRDEDVDRLFGKPTAH